MLGSGENLKKRNDSDKWSDVKWSKKQKKKKRKGKKKRKAFDCALKEFTSHV